jgi:hypothetical protein
MVLLFSATTETGFNPKVLQFIFIFIFSLSLYSLVDIFFGIRLKIEQSKLWMKFPKGSSNVSMFSPKMLLPIAPYLHPIGFGQSLTFIYILTMKVVPNYSRKLVTGL